MTGAGTYRLPGMLTMKKHGYVKDLSLPLLNFAHHIRTCRAHNASALRYGHSTTSGTALSRPRGKGRGRRWEPRIRVNERIRVREVRVVDAEGQQVGVMNTDKALALAKRAGFDLVEISPNARPPVCRICDFGKYQYEESKKKKKTKRAPTSARSRRCNSGPAANSTILISNWPTPPISYVRK